jgi:hypothetical protein
MDHCSKTSCNSSSPFDCLLFGTSFSILLYYTNASLFIPVQALCSHCFEL